MKTQFNGSSFTAVMVHITLVYQQVVTVLCQGAGSQYPTFQAGTIVYGFMAFHEPQKVGVKYMPRSGIAISHGNLMFIFLKNCFFSAFLFCQ